VAARAAHPARASGSGSARARCGRHRVRFDEAALAADLYRRLKRPRQREIAIAIAACAIAWNAAFWTLNPEDFTDIPGLELAG